MRELPHSKETGLMLHEILEAIDFHQAGECSRPEHIITRCPGAADIIDSAIHRHIQLRDPEDLDGLRIETARVLWNTLHAPLNNSGLALKSIIGKIHEVEFHFPSSVPAQVPHEIAFIEGYIHGFIDMIFRHEGAYYIVDWKSNYIEDGYAPGLLERGILDMRYDIQITLYAQALIRWLKSAVSDYSYDRHFGGVYYLYLRGMDIQTPGSGVYFIRPSIEQIESMNILK